MTEPYPFLHSHGWARHVDFFARGQHLPLVQKVEELRAGGKTIFPPRQDIFAAFAHSPWDAVRVVIMGQDPYHGAGQAHGLAFSVPEHVKIPPSLRNILAEVARCRQLARLGDDAPAPLGPLGDDAHGPPRDAAHGLSGEHAAAQAAASPCLTRWAEQGVLLLNTVLTVEAGKPESHKNLGWQDCTTAVLSALAARPSPLAVLLWGAAAQGFHGIFTAAEAGHLVLQAAHPSPLSAYRGFHGCGHFATVNDWLVRQGHSPIAW